MLRGGGPQQRRQVLASKTHTENQNKKTRKNRGRAPFKMQQWHYHSVVLLLYYYYCAIDTTTLVVEPLENNVFQHHVSRGEIQPPYSRCSVLHTQNMPVFNATVLVLVIVLRCCIGSYHHRDHSSTSTTHQNLDSEPDRTLSGLSFYTLN